ncbi:MAG: RluA family pseudouridine synthase [Clostridia bacterium]|nr:RluA family pseudouridine synthase [Clostridia bacterium]
MFDESNDVYELNAVDKCRLDNFIAAERLELSRSRIKKLIEEGYVAVNSAIIKKAGHTLRAGDSVRVTVPPVKSLDLSAADLPIEIIYEDDDLAVVNKPQGMVVHPAPGAYDNTLVNALLFRLKTLSSINGVCRPGIVHRLDKDTSGLLVVAKNDFAHVALQSQIAEKSAIRKYYALLEGELSKDSGIIDNYLDRSAKDGKKYVVAPSGRRAVTLYNVERRYYGYTLVEFELKTGRTHQIRVHSRHLGHPVVGDKQYGNEDKKFGLKGQLLHAYKLELTHPRTGERMTFTAPVPQYFADVLSKLKVKN